MNCYLAIPTLFLAATIGLAQPGSLIGYEQIGSMEAGEIETALNIAFGMDAPPVPLTEADPPIKEWTQALHIDQPAQYQNSVWWARTLLLFHGVVLIVSIVTGLWVIPIIVSFHTFFADWLHYFVGMTQHCGLIQNTNDFRKSVRSITLNPIAEFLYWRMNWHIEHHMYAGVPCYNLKKLYRELANDMPTPRTLIGAWKEMRETWQRQQLDPYYQFDTPLPKTAGNQHQEPTDELEYSIGDLAPRGMK